MRALVTAGIVACAVATHASAQCLYVAPDIQRLVVPSTLPLNGHIWIAGNGPVKLLGPSGEVAMAERRFGANQRELIPAALEPEQRYRLVSYNDRRSWEITTGATRDTTPPPAPADSDGHYALPSWPDTVVFEITAARWPDVVTFAVPATDPRLLPLELRYEGGLPFITGDTICYRVRAVDGAGNRSAPVQHCFTTDKDFVDASIDDQPCHDVVGLDDPLSGFTGLLMLSLFTFMAVVFALVHGSYRAAATAPTATPTSLYAVKRLARRGRGVAALILIAYAAATALSLLAVPLGFWLPVAALATMWRAQAALSGDAATVDKGYVHVWRDGTLHSWLRVRPKRLAQLALPSARARKRGMLD